MPEILYRLLREHAASGKRSTAMQPLLWLIALLCAACIGAARVNAPFWLTALIGTAVAASVGVALCAYVFFMIKDPDALRNESFVIRKMEIERGIVGDDIAGEFSSVSDADVKQIRSPD